ncbi:PilC/PilY family type IV pilus protein [Candidatus Pelagibacter sp.]|nr:PilC/PilY family type IV pilus protein [Candidatus Pelagibacter sp.]
MKIKFLISTLVLFFSFVSTNVSSKILPPGTGTQADVPSNLLILLDKSGSMGWRMRNAQGLNYMYVSATDSSGNIYIAQYSTYGVSKYNYSDMSLDTSWGSNGIVGKSGSCRTYYPYGIKVHDGIIYVSSMYDRKIRKIRVSDGACLGSINTPTYPRQLDIHNGHLYVGTVSGLWTYNISNGASKICPGTTGNQWKYTHGIAGSGNYLYNQYGYYFYRGTLTSSGSNLCPTSIKSYYDSTMSYGYGFAAHPTNPNEFYFMSRGRNAIYKITINSNHTWRTINWTKGRYGYGKTSTATQNYFYYPWGIHYDDDNDRLIVSGYNAKKIQVFDNNGVFIKDKGGMNTTTRMAAAHDAIKAIVTDSNLTSGVNFGFGYWSSRWSARQWPPGFSSWSGNITTGSARPCDTQNCLKVRVHKDGAAQINKIISSVNARGGTDAYTFMKIAQDYYNHGSLSPIDTKSPCQKSYVIVIGDGDWSGHSSAMTMAKNLFRNKKVPTFAVAFGTGISSSGLRRFNDLAKAGGTTKAIIAPTAAALKTQLQAAISQIIASKLSFTAPAITATLNEDGSLYQAQFDYAQNKEWNGTIKRTKIDKNGKLYPKDKDNWSAVEKLPKSGNRKIWSAIPNTDYKTNYNNWTTSNSSEIDDLVTLMGFDVQDYHRTSNNTDGSTNNKRCANASGVADGTDDDLKGLINFIRGTDYFDYDADCNLTEDRPNPMGDVYHSQLVTVGPPTAETAFTSENQESYWRSTKGYDKWAETQRNRKTMIYVGSNSGVLHALNADTGIEEWGFIPPFVATRLTRVMNTNLNQVSPAAKGGSNAIYGVDGSPVQHDIWFESPHDTSPRWHTVLFVPYGRGGSGFTVLDVTDPVKPLHLVSIYNDLVNNKVYRMSHDQQISMYDYIGTSYALSELKEAKRAGDNYAPDKGSEVASKQVCNDGGTSYCYKSKKWTLEVKNLTKSDLTVMEDGKDITGSVTITYDSAKDTVINFNKEMQFDADETTGNKLNSPIGITIKSGAVGTGVLTDPEWDYSSLGETWSDPRMFRLPNKGAGDTNREDDLNVAVMGGGFGTQFSGAGSNVMIINLQDRNNYGKLEKVIQIEDTAASDIDNSVPASLTVITPDKAKGANFAGSLVYAGDLEGKITKINLTNMSADPLGVPIKLYDHTTLFKAGATKTNGRFMYHAVDAAIGQSTSDLWLFAGTGDAQRLNDRTKGTQNLMIGIRDTDYPNYKSIATPAKAADITKCENTTNDTSGKPCRVQNNDLGWYVTLKDFAKVSAQPKVNNGYVYFPVYRPSKSVNKCDLGDAFICAVDDECGTHDSFIGLETSRSEQSGSKCRFVGKGVLSEIVLFAGKIFANISGKSLGSVTDLVTLDAATGESNTYRKSWRENN